jgi:hypothetical protein
LNSRAVTSPILACRRASRTDGILENVTRACPGSVEMNRINCNLSRKLGVLEETA